MTGAAGAVLALLSMGQDAGPGGLALATRLADHLLAAAARDGGAWSWRSVNGPREYDLTGLSHGAAGIGLALAELGAATGTARFGEAARRAFAYEERWFDGRTGNWPDLRGFRKGRGRPRRRLPCAEFWCHGAAGIALSRLRAGALLDEPRYLLDARLGRDTVRAWLARMHAGGGANFSLCHGLAGNAEALRLLSESLEPPGGSDRALVEDVARAGIERHSAGTEDWPCAAGGGPSPGLMLGLAGIGHFYLRLHDPATAAVLMPGPAPGVPGRQPDTAIRAMEAPPCPA
jgi:lantibiotic modifying enzyme